MASWANLDEVLNTFTRVSGQADLAARSIIAQSAAVVEAAAKSNFSGSHAKGQPHIGGDKPNIVTGTLRRSIRSDPVVRLGLGEYGTKVAPRVIYSRRVELGYTGGGGGRGHQTTRPFPYFGPAVEATRPALQTIAYTEWRRFIAA